MALGGVSLRRLLLAAILLPLVIRLQEVKAEGGGGPDPNSNGGETTEPETTVSTEASSITETTATEAQTTKKEEEVTRTQETDENTSVQDVGSGDEPLVDNGNDTDSRNATARRGDCPEECAEWKLEVLAVCGDELKGFDNLCYFYQYKCNNPDAGCHFYCCLYPGTDIPTASKFDCDDMCRF